VDAARTTALLCAADEEEATVWLREGAWCVDGLVSAEVNICVATGLPSLKVSTDSRITPPVALGLEGGGERREEERCISSR